MQHQITHRYPMGRIKRIPEITESYLPRSDSGWYVDLKIDGVGVSLQHDGDRWYCLTRSGMVVAATIPHFLDKKSVYRGELWFPGVQPQSVLSNHGNILTLYDEIIAGDITHAWLPQMVRRDYCEDIDSVRCVVAARLSHSGQSDGAIIRPAIHGIPFETKGGYYCHAVKFKGKR